MLTTYTLMETKKFMRNILIAIFISQSYLSFAAHLVGGEISYMCIGPSANGNSYQINLTLYRDCNSLGAPFDAQASIAIYGGPNQNTLITTLSVAHGPVVNIPAVVANPCLQTPPNVCTEKTSYTTNTTLPVVTHGYTIVYQRCCRNNTITNVANSGTWGNSYFIKIPPQDTVCNSSARFNQDPPIVMCKDDSLNVDFSVNELDGDSVFYSLCQPLHGASQNSPAPNPPSAPPYNTVPYVFPYSSTYPMPSNPQIGVNSSTGILSGTPIGTGQYVFAVCAEEYDSNGVLLSTLRRDYQFNVVNCNSLDSVISYTVSSTYYNPPNYITAVATGGTEYFWSADKPIFIDNAKNDSIQIALLTDSTTLYIEAENGTSCLFQDSILLRDTSVFICDVYDTTYISVYDTTYVTQIDTFYLTVTDTLIIDVSLIGINPPTFEYQVLVYPNPTNSYLYVDVPQSMISQSYSMEIKNSIGQSVFGIAMNQAQIQINFNSFGAAGSYTLSIKDSGGNVVDTRVIILQ
jgi:hypothetical protein